MFYIFYLQKLTDPGFDWSLSGFSVADLAGLGKKEDQDESIATNVSKQNKKIAEKGGKYSKVKVKQYNKLWWLESFLGI